MTDPTFGFIGFGEAAYFISKGLLADGMKTIHAFDVQAGDPTSGQIIRARANELSIELCDSLKSLCHKSDVILCATSAKAAEPIAGDIVPYLKSSHIYVDMNAASPMVKEKIAKRINGESVKFVDAAVMESIPPYQHKVPFLVSGDGAEQFQILGSRFGMNIRYIDRNAGSASAIKMFRSIFMKGFAMLLLETLDASKAYGVDPLIIRSISESIWTKPLDETADKLLARSALHAERRVAEMENVIETLESLDVDSTVSQAVKEKLQWLADARLKEYFQNVLPGHYGDVLDAMRQSPGSPAPRKIFPK